jgi:hypothetical protein
MLFVDIGGHDCSGKWESVMPKKSGGAKAGYLLVAILSLAFMGSFDAWAQPACHILDPTGTPLNVRTAPNGTILSTVPNGLLVSVIDRASDHAGKRWVYVADTASGRPIGWVFRQFIDCSSENNTGQPIIAAQYSNAGEARWCAQETSARGAVICADQRLWDLAQIRLKLFSLAKAKLSPDDYRNLLNEQ